MVSSAPPFVYSSGRSFISTHEENLMLGCWLVLALSSSFLEEKGRAFWRRDDDDTALLPTR